MAGCFFALPKKSWRLYTLLGGVGDKCALTSYVCLFVADCSLPDLFLRPAYAAIRAAHEGTFRVSSTRSTASVRS